MKKQDVIQFFIIINKVTTYSRDKSYINKVNKVQSIIIKQLKQETQKKWVEIYFQKNQSNLSYQVCQHTT